MDGSTAFQRTKSLCDFTAIICSTGFWLENGNKTNTNIHEKGIEAETFKLLQITTVRK